MGHSAKQLFCDFSHPSNLSNIQFKIFYVTRK